MPIQLQVRGFSPVITSGVEVQPTGGLIKRHDNADIEPCQWRERNGAKYWRNDPSGAIDPTGIGAQRYRNGVSGLDHERSDEPCKGV